MLSYQKIIKESPLVMGIINATPDSFSDGGLFANIQDALKTARLMVRQGAKIIDVGGESTRPGYQSVSADEELSRILPIISEMRNDNILISVDTQKSEVAEQAIKAGACMINNISSISNKEMTPLAAKLNCPLVITANRTNADDMKEAVADTISDLRNLTHFALQSGVKKENIIIDIGLGFGKTAAQNLQLIKHLAAFREMGYPIMVGASRKNFIGIYTGEEKADLRLGGSLAAAIIAVQNGAAILRVHDVAPTVQSLKFLRAIHDL